MKKVFNFILLMLVLQVVNAQKIEKYFDFQWKETSSENAMFYGVWEKVDSLWHRKDYYMHQKSLQMEGFFKDEACKVPLIKAITTPATAPPATKPVANKLPLPSSSSSGVL